MIKKDLFIIARIYIFLFPSFVLFRKNYFFLNGLVISTMHLNGSMVNEIGCPWRLLLSKIMSLQLIQIHEKKSECLVVNTTLFLLLILKVRYFNLKLKILK